MTAVVTFNPVFCACGRQLITAEQLASGMCEYCETASRGLCTCGALLSSPEELRMSECVSCLRRALVGGGT